MEEIKVGKISIPIVKGEKGDVGPAGATGPAGKTPQAGIDYYTEEEKAQMQENILSEVLAEVLGDVKTITYDEDTGILTIIRNTNESYTIDLPIERLVKSGYYDETNKQIVLNLDNDTTIVIPVSSLIDDLNSKLTNQEKKIEELEEELETLYGDFEPNTASGEVATINDGVDKSRVEVQGDGNSYQDTRVGYNLFPLSNYGTQTKNGVTVTQNKDGSFNATGTGTTNYITFQGGKDITDKLEDGETYTIWASKNTSLMYIQVAGAKADGSGTSYYTTEGSNRGFIVNKSTYSKYTANFQSGASSKDAVYDLSNMQFILVKGSYTNDTIPPFEQYGAMPSTEFPSDIEVIDMVNEFDISKITENKYINGNTGNSYGTSGSSAVSNTSDFMEVKANKTYTFKYDYDTLANTSSRSYCYYDLNKNLINSTINTNYVSSNKKTTLTPTQDGYVRISYDINCKDIMFYEGTDDKPYLPYGTIGLLQRNKNFLKIKDVEETTTNGVDHSIANNEITLNGTLTGGLLINSDSFNLKAGTYTFSSNVTNASGSYARYLLDATTNANLKTNNGTITLEEDTRAYFRFYANSGCVFNNSKVTAQVEVGEVATEYETPKSNLIPINLNGNTLAKVGYIKDLLNIGLDGSVSITQNNKLDIFDGSDDESWTFDQNRNRAYTPITTTDKANRTLAKCNMFKEGNTETNSNCYNVGGTQAFFRNDELVSSSDDMRNLIKEKPLQILYTIEKPNTIELPSIKPIKLFEGTNNFELVTSLPTTLTAHYKVSSKKQLIENNDRITALEATVNTLLGGN